ncbi:MAG: pyridoxal-phosphate dependent enzyme [Proteobacteria bacterium]|nr:pyridoxal-phosphate dependent enzyme [Pseudomonadota bacterium]
MAFAGLADRIIDRKVRGRAVAHLRQAGVRLPTFAELADPAASAVRVPAAVDPDAPAAANLFRVHWYNDAARRGRDAVPGYVELPSELTGIKARIVVALGERFPMIAAHKVLPAYACLVTRLITGGFDPTRHRAIWPSTGNYCRGGVAISRILGCRGVAVLPEGMSTERFAWLGRWVADAADIVRTPGTESNVKEIYDKCDELSRDETNVILNQFCEFANYLSHYVCTGRALERVFEDLGAPGSRRRLAAFVATTGSAGTLGAGDYLKSRHGTKIVAVEPVECPTLLANGYGAHNIQGIGDKHVPLIHNVMNTDLVVGVSDTSTDSLNALFNTEEGRRYLVERKQIDASIVAQMSRIGLSGLANVLAAIKTARHLELSEDDVMVTVATDSAALYASERDKTIAARFAGAFDRVAAAEVFGQHLAGIGSDHVLELGHHERRRIFNLGYFTWVEQQGVPLPDFDRRKDQGFWQGLQALVPAWDALIAEFNAESGVNSVGS